ncbi:hypothetical protein CY652_19825 [Burkholderia sp. WAC0059]|nr:hypothetical protein CY652_19825 [Burkholderia sp. WAC0059]
MKASMIDMLRAYLLAASLTAAFIDALMSLALAMGVSDGIFQSLTFRFGVLIAVACAVLIVRLAARSAFRSALAGRQVTIGGSSVETVLIRPACPRRELVILHLRFNRRLFAMASR